MSTATSHTLPPAFVPTTKRSWSKIAQSPKAPRTDRSRATSDPTDQPRLSPHRLETTRPRSQSPSPDVDLPIVTAPLEDPPQFLGNEHLPVLSEPTPKHFCRLKLQMHSEPSHLERLIDPYRVEIFVDPRDCVPQAQHEVGEILKIVLQEIHVLPDRSYSGYEGNAVVFRYTVFPLRKTLAQVKRGRPNLRRELAWRADGLRMAQLAHALSQAHINLIPDAPPVEAPSRSPSSYASRYPLFSNMEPSHSRSSYLEPQNSYVEPSSSPRSAYQSFVQPAVKHLVSKTKKKRAKLPVDYRARQNLVQLKHDKTLAMLHQWLLNESEEKIYLRGDNVAFIQVKCPRALHVVDTFLERILNDEEIEIDCCTAPLSRKRQGQLKGFLLYLTCKTADQVSRILDIFNKDFADSGLKCKVARFEKSISAPRASSSEDNSEGSETSI